MAVAVAIDSSVLVNGIKVETILSIKKNNAEFNEGVLLAVKKCSLVFIAWLVSIALSMYMAGVAHIFFVFVYYLLSIALYFVVVKVDEAIQRSGMVVHNKVKGSFGFVINLLTAICIHYFLFWKW